MPRSEGGPDYTAAERRLIARLRTPAAVQRFLNDLPYNTEPPPERAKLRSLRGVLRFHTANCLEAALAAAAILEPHGYPPLVLSFESIDELDHVIYVYREGGRWGSIGKSRDPGLHGRRAVFRTPRALAASYMDPYVDLTGRVVGYAVADLRALGDYNWRTSEKNVWKVERMLLDLPHRRLTMSEARYARLRARYVAFRERYPDRKPLDYRGREHWSTLPAAFSRDRSRGSAS